MGALLLEEIPFLPLSFRLLGKQSQRGYVTVCFCFSDPPGVTGIWLFGDVHIWIPI
jgi:hypothetical protein